MTTVRRISSENGSHPWPTLPGMDPAERDLAAAVGTALDALTDTQPWMRQARCVDADPGVFFPEKGDNPQAAKRLCETCPVTGECLAYALDLEADAGGRYGVFGGSRPNERARMANHRRQAAAPACEVEGCAARDDRGLCAWHLRRARRRAA